ncbi:MAG: hypothetical protein IK079_04505 [Desulfovibrio sp.]|nr:hypothetical protein [Desulfovibrio sp.]
MRDKTDWVALERMTDEEAYINAISDPDNPPIPGCVRLDLHQEDGKTVLERFRKALEREKKESPFPHNDDDVARWLKNESHQTNTPLNA